MAKFDENYFKNDGMKATTIEDTLAKDEQILWRGKPKRSAYICGQIFRMMPFAFIWLIFDGAFLGCMFGFGLQIWLRRQLSKKILNMFSQTRE